MRGQDYTLTSYHTAYARFVRYSDEEEEFLFSDAFGISGFGPGDYPSPTEISAGQSLEIVNETIDLGRTSVTLQVPLTAPPQLTSIDTDHGIPGGNLTTTLRGSNLFGGSQSVQVYGPNGVTASITPGQTPNNIEALEIHRTFSKV